MDLRLNNTVIGLLLKDILALLIKNKKNKSFNLGVIWLNFYIPYVFKDLETDILIKREILREINTLNYMVNEIKNKPCLFFY
jgi:hypothetical protein